MASLLALPLIVQAQNAPDGFFVSALLPPSNGVLLAKAPDVASSPNGVAVRNLRLRSFNTNFPPPADGIVQTNTYRSQAEMEVSTDGGSTFQRAFAFADLAQVVAGHGSTNFDLSLQTIAISGGTLPAGVAIRKDAAQPSSGTAVIRTVAGGYKIGGFFDVWLELSRGGAWASATNGPFRLEWRADPDRVPALQVPSPLLPPPNGTFATPGAGRQEFESGIVIKEIRQRFPTAFVPPPSPGDSSTVTFDPLVDFQMALDGVNFRPFRVPALASMRIANLGGIGPQAVYDIEMDFLLLSGGDLSPEFFLRASPTERSWGTASLTTGVIGGGGVLLHGFCDVWLELSTNRGQTWQPATTGPAHLEWVREASEQAVGTASQPSPNGTYVSPLDQPVAFTSGVAVAIQNLKLSSFTTSLAPPPQGMNPSLTFGARVDLQFSTGGGAFVSVTQLPAVVTMSLSNIAEYGPTRYFHAEMLGLALSNGLPAGVMIRESPARASVGRTSLRDLGPARYQASSFFHVYLELSQDGGRSWSPAANGFMRWSLDTHLEEDFFRYSLAALTFENPGGAREETILGGPGEMVVYLGPDGECSDTDGDGLDDAVVSMAFLNLAGQGSSGPIAVRLTSGTSNLGEFEDQANARPGLLEAAAGASGATSFLDLSLDVQMNGVTLRTAQPLHLQGAFTRQPPAPAEAYTNSSPVDLLNPDGSPSGRRIVRCVYVPNPEKEVSLFPRAQARITLMPTNGAPESVNLIGSAAQEFTLSTNRTAADTDSNGRDEAPTQLSQLNLRGDSSLGGVNLRLRQEPFYRSYGQIEERNNAQRGTLEAPPFAPAGTAESFFDMWFELEVGGNVYVATQPARWQADVIHQPPAEGEAYRFSQPLRLLDTNGVEVGLQFVPDQFVPNPPNPVVPALAIVLNPAGQAEVSWPYPSPDFVLQIKNDLDPAVAWQPYPSQPQLINGRNVVTIDPAGPRFLRLFKPRL